MQEISMSVETFEALKQSRILEQEGDNNVRDCDGKAWAVTQPKLDEIVISR